MKNKRLICYLCLLPICALAQVHVTISYADYMERVKKQNLSFAAEKLNVSIAQAEVVASRVFNDPSLAFEYGDNQDHRLQMGRSYAVELSKTFSIGKRSARICLAQREKELAESLLDDFFRNLQSEAAMTYLEAIKQQQLYDVKRSSYQYIAELAKADSLRFALGGNTEVDALQSKVEADIQQNELSQTEIDLYHAYLNLNIPLGRFSADTLYISTGSLQLPACTMGQNELLSLAVDNRADLVAAMKNIEVARKALALTKRERGLDVDVALGYSHNNEVRNEIAPAPKFNALTVGLSVPLKFSNLNKGEVKSAQYRILQAENEYQQAQLEVQNEVMKNYHAYVSMGVQVNTFNKGMLDKSSEVIKGKTYSYNRGETSLLEVLDAQRTYNDVRALYIETLFNYASSLVQLEKSAGIWDICIQ